MNVKHSKHWRVVALLLAALLPLGASALAAGKKKTFAADKGPAVVDVSKFSPKIQAKYKIFAARCSKCHTLARPINTNMTKAGWKQYVKRMMNKPDSGISPAQGKKIYGFLKYYQRVKDARKKAGK